MQSVTLKMAQMCLHGFRHAWTIRGKSETKTMNTVKGFRHTSSPPHWQLPAARVVTAASRGRLLFRIDHAGTEKA
jgi:hypothetical protein